eukprot:TRINITY_DN1352_c0_g1_i2.p1 TRINITY_DN1352_c0_g1~~TRINITY_DN1352_c0_g1_i2.p1  ORF type:complete len:238 (+),score=7.73 TRINITY_DN1352_c0_g1_i2:355-1068(+)
MIRKIFSRRIINVGKYVHKRNYIRVRQIKLLHDFSDNIKRKILRKKYRYFSKQKTRRSKSSNYFQPINFQTQLRRRSCICKDCKRKLYPGDFVLLNTINNIPSAKEIKLKVPNMESSKNMEETEYEYCPTRRERHEIFFRILFPHFVNKRPSRNIYNSVKHSSIVNNLNLPEVHTERTHQDQDRTQKYSRNTSLASFKKGATTHSSHKNFFRITRPTFLSRNTLQPLKTTLNPSLFS